MSSRNGGNLHAFRSLYKYAQYFAKRHPRVIEDEKAVEVVVRLEEDAYAAEAGGLGRSLTVRKVKEVPAQVGEAMRSNSPESDNTAVAPGIGINMHPGAPLYEPYYNQDDLDIAGSGASTPARHLTHGHTAVDFAAARSREQSRERSQSRPGQRDDGQLHYAASMVSMNSEYSSVYDNHVHRASETRWI